MWSFTFKGADGSDFDVSTENKYILMAISYHDICEFLSCQEFFKFNSKM